jgi:2-iminoacetate synthase ThiH
MKKPLFDDEEFYVNDSGLLVFNAEYLLKRGYCCGNGCLHCPFDYKNVLDLEKKRKLLEKKEIEVKKKNHA